MTAISFPSSFPSEEKMMNVLKKTMEKSWRIDLDIENIERWLNNFSGKVFNKDTERKLALWLLCNFTYYNEDEVNYLCELLFSKLIHQILIDEDKTSEEEAEECVLSSAFTSIGRASESGGLLLYHFRQEAQLDLDRFIFPTAIEETPCDKIICIDDVMISGGTASRFFHAVKDRIKDKKIYYITLITTDAAIEKLMALGISVIYCIKLDERNRVFSDQSLVFYKFPELLQHTKKLAEEYGKIIEPEKPLGHKSGQFLFGLYYNIPNNCLPIFWSSNNWEPIFERKEKYQNAKQAKRKYDYYI